MKMLCFSPPEVQSETPAEFFARLARQDADDRTRLERTYPLLIETTVATVPRSENALLTAVAAFLEGLGLEPGFCAGALIMDFLGRSCELRLTDLDAVSQAMATPWDDAEDRDLEAQARVHSDMEFRALCAAWDTQFDEVESRLDRRLAELGKDVG